MLNYYQRVKEASMFHSLAHQARQDAHHVAALWRTIHWTVLITLVILLIGLLCVGVRVAH